jgi:hypothetical protein
MPQPFSFCRRDPIDWGQVYLGQNDPIGDSPRSGHFERLGTVPNQIILYHSGTDLFLDRSA